VRGVERLDATRLRLALAGPAELDATVRDLVERESQCCSFFSQCCSFFPFTLTTDRPGHIVLDIGNPAAYVDVLDALTRRVTAQAAR
jgi:hypothetical protein